MAHLVDHADHRRCEFLGAVRPQHRNRDVGLDATELGQEVDVEIGAAKLTVGDALKPDILLEIDDLGDRLVLDQAQLLGADFLLDEELLARVEQVFRAQKAADMVGAKRRFGAKRHIGVQDFGWLIHCAETPSH